MLFKEPEISVEDVSLTDFSLTDLTLLVNLTVDNPNMFGITFQSITCDVMYQNNGQWEPLSYAETQDVQIEKGKNTVPVQVYAKNIDLLRVGLSILKNREITIKVDGIAKPSFFGLSPEIPFTHTESIPIPGLSE